MSKIVVAGAAGLSMSFVLAACSGGGGSPGPGSPAPPPPIVKTYAFTPGHATSPSGGTAWDIIGVTTTLTGRLGGTGNQTYDTLRVDVTFAQDVSNALPAPGQKLSSLTQLGVAVGFDSDNNTATGTITDCRQNSNYRPLEYISDVGTDPSRLQDGNYSIIGPSGIPIYSGASSPGFEAVTNVSASVVSESFFLPAINTNNAVIPKFGIIVASANYPDETDCVPNDGRIVLPVS